MEKFKALSDPVRMEIAEMVAKSKMSAGDISAQFDLSNATISHHLNILRKAKIINQTKYKNFIFYELNKEEVLQIIDDINRLANLKK